MADISKALKWNLIEQFIQKGSYFVWPEKEDSAFTDIDDIHLSLSVPLVDRRQHYRFEDVEMEQMKNCCH